MVVQYGIVSAEYFMDRLKPYELQLITEALHLRYKDSWEQSRFICYMIAQVNSKKRLKATDIMKFPWEKQGVAAIEHEHREVTAEYVEMVRKAALEREKKLKEKGII